MCLTKLAAKNIDFLSQLFEGGSLKSWNDLKIEYNLTNETYFQWLQLKHAIPQNWKTIIKQNPGHVSDLLIHDHHLFKGARIWTLEKLSSKELYSILITKLNVHFEKIFPSIKLDWRKIYILTRITTVNTYLCSFQYEILNNILFLHKKLFVFRKKNTPLCLFCNKKEETLLHIFGECTYVIYLWQQLATFFKNNLILPALTPQTVVLGLWSDNCIYIYMYIHLCCLGFGVTFLIFRIKKKTLPK